MTTRRGPAQELRATIDGLPLAVRQAVLEGIKSQRIIAGAHVDGAGGVCPMVAAEVSWKQISQASVERAQETARAWDRYAQANGAKREATKRQLLALRAMLEASIMEESAAGEMPLAEAIAEYQDARTRHLEADAPTFATPEMPLAEAIADHQRAKSRYASADVPTAPAASSPRRDTGERDRTRELRKQAGWSWLRPFRSYDEYEDALLLALSQIDDSRDRELAEQPVR